MRLRIARPATLLFVRHVIVVVLTAGAWLAWWAWPPTPELRLQFENRGTYGHWEVAPDGQSLLYTKTDKQSTPPYHTDGTYHFEILDLPSGKPRAILSDASGLKMMVVSPDGQRLLCQDARGKWHLFAAHTGELICGIEPSDSNDPQWTPDGRHFSIERRAKPNIYRADTGELVKSLDHATPLGMLANGAGLLAMSRDGNKVELWDFDPLRVVASFALPNPSSGEHGYSSAEPPKPGTLEVRKLGASLDGQVIVAVANRFEPEGRGLAAISCIECWDRRTGRRVEVTEGNYDVQHAGNLQLSTNGRVLNHGGAYWLGTYNVPDWLEWRQIDRDDVKCWDIARDPPQRLGNEVFAVAADSDYPRRMDPTGKRMVLTGESDIRLFDANTFAAIAIIPVERHHGNEAFDARGKYLAVQVTPLPPPTWLPTWTPSFITKRYVAVDHDMCVIRLSDGKITRRLVDRDSSTFTSDGKFWTTTICNSDVAKGDYDVTLERWSPEVKWPAWWLWPCTAAGIAAIVIDRRRSTGAMPLP